MKTVGPIMLIVIVLSLGSTAGAAEPGPPAIPVGFDAYRAWDRWAYQRIARRAYMRSTYDRQGGNEGADASHFLYQRADDDNVTLDVEGKGILYFARYNHWHGSPWRYTVDDVEQIVQESSTADPVHPKADSVFLPSDAFPRPLAWTWSTTKGADLSWVPIPFEKSFRMAYSRTRYGTGYYIYHQYVGGANLSQPIKAWDVKAPVPPEVIELIDKSGTPLVPVAESDGGRRMKLREKSGEVALPAGGETTLMQLKGEPGMIRAVELSAPRGAALDLAKVRLRITWDDRREASVDAPLPLFFGTGTLHNPSNKEFLVKAFPMHVRFDQDRVHLGCYLPMPFFRAARIELVNAGAEIAGVRWSIRHTPFDDPSNHVGYLHATYADHPTPARGRDLILLDTVKAEGGGDWSGQFVGTTLIFSHKGNLGTLEGDPRFFFDDSQTPQAQGTGTEEWCGGGDYWGGRNMTLPFAGHPVGTGKGPAATPEAGIESGYRFLLADLMPFGKNARIQLEHGGQNESTEHYETVTYWYGLPAASLVKTDTLKIADEASEQAHGYVSPEASMPEKLSSRYEWGPDHSGGQENYPAETDTGRHTKGTSEFTLKLRADNLGVMLRRKLDYGFPHQRAEVYVADAAKDKAGAKGEWRSAGTWYLAGSNVCIYSNPKEELGATEHNVRTSNRRFRDDEFLIPRELTSGRDAIRVRVKFTPVERPFFPGGPVPTLAWSEFQYDAYCFVMPAFPAK